MTRTISYHLSTLSTALFLLGLLLSIACGTLQMGVERMTSPPQQVAAVTTVPTSISQTVITGQSTQPETQITAEPTNEPVTITGVAMQLDFPSGWVKMVPETETPLADTDGTVAVQITEWAKIVNADHSLAAREDLSRGARLEVMGLLQNGTLLVDQVVILSLGVQPPDKNPAYTDVSGRVTPQAGPPPTSDEAISLFEASGEYAMVDPGATVTLKWAFAGQSGTICEHVTPQPMTQTCYQDLPPSGSLDVVVSSEARGAIGYWLYVQLEEAVAEKLVIVPLTAERGCEHQWFFNNADYPYKLLLECPTSAPVASEIRPQAQFFEKGLMIRLEKTWFGQEAWLVALVVFDKFDKIKEGQEYALGFPPIVDPWSPGMPDTDPDLTPPDGLFQPSQGFGLLWRGEIQYPTMGEPMVLHGLETLGWATGAVFAYDALYQCYESTHGRAPGCFISGPDEGVLRLPGKP